MSFFGHTPITRRTLLASLSAALLIPYHQVDLARGQTANTAVPLDHGLEVRDYRLFPTDDVMRFIVELHNTTDTAVDTPTVGVVLPHLDGQENFAWAHPVSPVLHPHTSDCLIGVAPKVMSSDGDWGAAEWTICDTVQTTIADNMESAKFDFEHSTNQIRATQAQTVIEVTNKGAAPPRNLILQGLVWDADRRLCGALLPASLARIAPGETKELIVNVHPGMDYTANPFALIDSATDLEVSFSVQPNISNIDPGCPAVMPWNETSSNISEALLKTNLRR